MTSASEVDKTYLSTPVFLGFLPKKITPCPEWLKAKVPPISQICSVSRCISERPPRMFNKPGWNYNRAGLFNDFESAFDEIPPDEKGKYEIFVYKGYPIQIAPGGVYEIDLLKHLPGCSEGIVSYPDLRGFHRIGGMFQISEKMY